MISLARANLLKLMEKRNVYSDKNSLDPKTGKLKLKHKLYSNKIASVYLFYVLTSKFYNENWVKYEINNDFEWVNHSHFSKDKGSIDPKNIDIVKEDDVIAKYKSVGKFVLSGKIKQDKIDELKEKARIVRYLNAEELVVSKLAAGIIERGNINPDLLRKLNL